VDQTQAAIEKIRAVMQRDPGVVVVAAHDARVQADLGFFPAWVKWRRAVSVCCADCAFALPSPVLQEIIR
jgi:hypothetical protein